MELLIRIKKLTEKHQFGVCHSNLSFVTLQYVLFQFTFDQSPLKNMLYFKFAPVLLVSVSAFAAGCPPWLPCGKKGNLIIADSSYSSQVAAAEDAALSSAAGFALQQPFLKATDEINRRIENAQSLARTASVTTIRMLENGEDAFRQRYLLMHPKPQFWGYDWGLSAK